MPKKPDTVYRIYYAKRGESTYELHARSVGQSDMLGFIEVSDFVSPKRTSKIIQPGIDRVEHEFAGVARTFIPISDVRRVDALSASSIELEEGPLKVIELKTVSSPS